MTFFLLTVFNNQAQTGYSAKSLKFLLRFILLILAMHKKHTEAYK